jgi:hypothetical protein
LSYENNEKMTLSIKVLAAIHSKLLQGSVRRCYKNKNNKPPLPKAAVIVAFVLKKGHSFE